MKTLRLSPRQLEDGSRGNGGDGSRSSSRGGEFVIDGVLGGRSREEYLEHLRAKVNVSAIEFHEAATESRERPRESNANVADGADRPDHTEMHIGPAASAKFAMLSPLRLSSLDIPGAAPHFTGLSKTVAVDAILGKLSQWLPVTGKRRSEVRQVEAWALFRFTELGMRKIAKLLRTSVGEVEEAIHSVRALREKERAWWRAIWNADWSLRRSLAAAPWRE